MARCWTCGAHIEKPLFTCPACSAVKEIQGLRKESAANLGELAEVQQRGFEELSNILSDGLSEIASVIEWGFEEVNWRLQQQTKVLKSIDHTLKTPTQTQANEWRQMAEELRSRGVLGKSEEFFRKSLEANPLDYRTYTGLAEAYLQMDRFDEAKTYLEESLPHAPVINQERKQLMIRAARIDPNTDVIDGPIIFNYKSYSYRLIGHIYACKEDYPNAVSALRLTVQLSPLYHEAKYDLAQYSAQIRDRETCLAILRGLIDVDIFYLYLAEKERNFEPLSLEIRDLLTEINTDAFDRAEKMIKDAERSVGVACEALKKCRTREKLMARSVSLLEDAKSKLETAKHKMALGDYKASLDAIPIGKEAYNLADRAKSELDRIPEHYRNARSKRWREALAALFGRGIGFGLLGALVGAFGGCAIGIFSRDVSVEEGVGTCAILGILLGLLLGIWAFLEKLNSDIE